MKKYLLIITAFTTLSTQAQNVGIGTSNPQSKLDVNGGLTVGSLYSGTNAAPANGAIIQGYVGIGTTQPINGLHIHESDAVFPTNGEGLQITSASFGATNTDGFTIRLSPITAETRLLNYENASLIFGTDGNDRMHLSPNGFLGIGTPTPDNYLHIFDDRGIFPTLKISTAIANQGGRLWMETSPSPKFELVNDEASAILRLKNAAGAQFDLTATGGVNTTIATGQDFKINTDFSVDADGKTVTKNFQMTNGADLNKILRSDASGNASWVNGTSTVKARNGTNVNTDDPADPYIELGGPLMRPTTIDQGANTLDFTATSVNAFSVDGTTLSVDANNNRVGMGTATPGFSLDVRTTDAVKMPTGTTAERPASPIAGATRFNSDNKSLEYYDGTQWVSSNVTQVPVGSIVPFAGGAIPSGWLACDGASYTTATYPDLHTAIGYTWGGAGANFNVPDLRGRFLRGVDGAAGRDPDAGGRTSANAGGNAGNNVGSVQGDAVATHTHGVNGTSAGSGILSTLSDGNHVHSVDPPSTSTSTNGNHFHLEGTHSESGANFNVYGQTGSTAGWRTNHTNASWTQNHTSTTGNHTHTLDITAFNSANDGNHSHTIASHTHSISLTSGNPSSTSTSENRPKNANVRYIIKATNNTSVAIVAANIGSGSLGQTLYNDGSNWVATSNLYSNGSQVAIGNTAPQQALSVTGAVNIDQGNTNSGSVNAGLTFGSASGEGIASKRTAGGNQNGLYFYTSATNRMSITTTGSVGIGNSAPNATLDVKGAGSTNATFGFGVRNSADTYTIAVRDDGRVGVGTVAPSMDLQIGNVGEAGLQKGDASPNAGYLRFGDNTGWKYHFGRLRESSGGAINTNTTGVVMTLQDNGNVGVGIAGPTEKLEVIGSIKIPAANATDNGSPGFILASDDDFLYNGVYLNHYGFGFHDPTAGCCSGSYISGYSGIDLFTGSANRLSILEGGNVGIGDDNPNAMLTVQKGIGIGTGNGVSVTHGGRRSLQFLSDLSYGGTYDNHSGYLLYSTMPGGWGTATLNFAVSTDWGTYNTTTPTLTLSGSNVGIRNTNPGYPLEVSGTVALGLTAMRWFTQGSALTASNQAPNVSIRANGAIWASGGGFYASSDLRAKNNIETKNAANSLVLINRLNVVKYNWIDATKSNHEFEDGFIAQEVEKIIPQAVNKATDFLPNVYALADKYDIKKDELHVSMSKEYDIKLGDVVKFFTEDGKEYRLNTINTDGTKYSFALTEEAKSINGELFVYGKEVDDFNTVDYDRIFTIGISAIQELSKKVDALEKENASLKSENTEMMKSLKAQIEVINERLSIKSDK